MLVCAWRGGLRMVSVEGAVPCWLAVGFPLALTYLLLRVVLATPGYGIGADFRVVAEMVEEMWESAIAAAAGSNGNQSVPAQEL